MTNYTENLKKRIILVVIGILCYYFAAIPISLVPRLLLPGDTVSYLLGFSLYSLVSIGLLFYFVYRALFKVNPSLMPITKKHKKAILVATIMIPGLFIAFSSGLVVPEWEQGECTISSSMRMQDGTLQGSTTSQTVSGISECLNHCRYQDDFNPELEKTCQFRGLFDSTPTAITDESAEHGNDTLFDVKIK